MLDAGIFPVQYVLCSTAIPLLEPLAVQAESALLLRPRC